MAPEQGDEERYDRRVVVFGLGGVFFDLLAKLRCISIDRLHDTLQPQDDSTSQMRFRLIKGFL